MVSFLLTAEDNQNLKFMTELESGDIVTVYEQCGDFYASSDGSRLGIYTPNVTYHSELKYRMEDDGMIFKIAFFATYVAFIGITLLSLMVLHCLLDWQ